MGISCSCQLLNFSRARSEYVCDGIGRLSVGGAGGAGHWIATGGDTDGVEQPVTLSAKIISSAAQSGFTGASGIGSLQLSSVVFGGLAVVGGLQDAGGFGDGELVVGECLGRASLCSLGIADLYTLAEQAYQQQRDGRGVEPGRHQVEDLGHARIHMTRFVHSEALWPCMPQ